ncbi:MAG: hypothetical protein KAW46_08685 [candidate division Zixibacteria bacterium]|nr:hypothetical protein [candidate division Zixibacteria bacterium]
MIAEYPYRVVTADKQPGLLEENSRMSAEAVRVMKEIGQSRSLSTMIAPVRPSAKHLYPLTDAARYIEWQTDEGLPFDPWLRVHVRLGGEIVKVCPRASALSAR